MALELSLDGLAAVSLFVANVVVGVVAIGTYWRMTRYEQSNHLHIVNALRETRDAGREAKIATRELLRMVERQEQGRGVALQASDLEALRELPQLLRLLLEGREGEDGTQEPAQRLRWPDTVQELNQEGLDQLKRSHRNEVDRMLAQRRHLQMELSAARERLEENARVLNSFRSRTSQSLQSQVELSGARQQLEQTRNNMLQLQDKLAQMETRADKAERNVARLQRDLEQAALGAGEATPAAQAQTEQASRETLLSLEREAQAQRDHLADAERTIQKLRKDLEILAADPPDHEGERSAEPGHDQARARLETEVEQLKARVDDLQDALRRNVVEKEFIEQHYLAETRKRQPPAEP
ncbi:hypothetical protein [Paucibacter soli]|uniref:hypothetical protein n=1 Tax=Paucibacter soli TaxID=3133433 RepID=UPI0030B465AA